MTKFTKKKNFKTTPIIIKKIIEDSEPESEEKKSWLEQNSPKVSLNKDKKKKFKIKISAKRAKQKIAQQKRFGNSPLLTEDKFNAWFKKYTLLKNHCGWTLDHKYKSHADQHVKRVNPSLFHQVLENKEPTKYASGGGMESYVREVWENEKNLTKGVNYLTECPICVPKYCYVGGIIDGFLYKSDGSPVIVEFKGKFENVRDSEPASGNLMNFDKRLLQILIYSFLAGWVDVWFIWAEEKGYDKRMKANKAEIHSVEYNFSESKPFEEELIKLFNGPLVTYFIKYIWKNKTKEEYIVDENPDKYELLVQSMSEKLAVNFLRRHVKKTKLEQMRFPEIERTPLRDPYTRKLYIYY